MIPKIKKFKETENMTPTPRVKTRVEDNKINIYLDEIVVWSMICLDAEQASMYLPTIRATFVSGENYQPHPPEKYDQVLVRMGKDNYYWCHNQIMPDLGYYGHTAVTQPKQ